MKSRNLLFMGALLLAGSSVSAQVVDREKPVPQKSALQYGEPMYLYNVGAKQLFKGANDYNTRGSVGEAGYKVWFTKHLENGAWDNKSVIFKDSVETQKAIKMVWQAANGDVWVDWANQADTLWTVTPLGDELYRFSVGAGNASFNSATYPDVFLGVKSAEVATNTRLFWNLTLADGFIDWYFVSVKDAQAYAEKLKVFTTAETLKGLIKEAVAAGADVNAQIAVYNNANATVEELEAAAAAVKTAIAAAAENSTTAANPLDKTSLIVNPSYDANKKDGWSGTAPDFQSYGNAEHYNKTFDTYQDIKGAPKGVYALELSAFYRAGNTETSYNNYKNGNANLNAKLYAKAGADSLNASIMNPFAHARTTATANGETSWKDGANTYYVPNNMQSAAEYFKLGLYSGNKLFFATEDGAMRIGVKKTTGIGSDWLLFDNWKLTYYGNGADAYSLWLEQVKKDAKDYSALPEGTLVTQSVVEDYTNFINGLTSASTKADVLDAIATLEEKALLVDSNMIAWTAYQEALTKGKAIANDEKIQGQDKDDLADYCDLEAEEIIGALALTTEEVKAEIEKVKALTDAAIRNGITEGTDVSDKYLVNANFEKTNGWVKEAASGGNVNYGGNDANHCYEAWNNSKFDIHQEVKDAPLGVYELSVQGFYRYGRGDNAYQAYKDGKASNDVVSIYVNNNETHFMSVFDEHVSYTGNKTGELYKYEGGNPPYINPDSTYWYPNNMAVAATAFANGLYKVSSFGVVAKKGDVLRVGVKGNTSQLKDSWAIWDNFKMTFQGTKAEVVAPLLQQEIDNLSTTLATTGVMAPAVRDAANTTKSEAQAAKAANDGPEMFAALTKLLDAKDSINTSVALFKTLATKRDELASAVGTSEAIEATKIEAGTLLETINSGLDAQSIENADANKLIADVDAMVAKLAIPAEAANASDENPVDMTSVIKTPDYEKDGANSVEGWTAEGYNFGNSDTQKGALLLEFFNNKFNHFQKLTNLPNGTYKVTVNAFYRFGSSAEDYTKFNADNRTEGNAFMYAVAAADSVKCPLNLLASGATEDRGYTGTTKLEGTELFVPNDMVSAKAYFGEGGYLNNIIVEVTDGTLTIGVRQDAKVDNDWVILDTWTLTYFGSNSTKQENGWATGVDAIRDAAEAVKTEFFGINGAQKTGLTQGVNIVKTTLKDGSVKVRKVIIK